MPIPDKDAIFKNLSFEPMNRSDFFRNLAVMTAGILVTKSKTMASADFRNSGTDFLYIGRYTAAAQEGIPYARFDALSGDMVRLAECPKVVNPSFIALDPGRRFLYAVNEIASFEGKGTGSVSAFRCDGRTGRLTLLNVVSSRGADPCHLAVDNAGRHVLVANYTGGNIAVLPILRDGSLGEATDIVQHTGHGPNSQRQRGPHAHSIVLSPDNRFAYSCDLGTDKILIYKYDDRKGKLNPAATPYFAAEPGSGPRHISITPDGERAYSVNEMASTLQAFRRDRETGGLELIQTANIVPEGFTGENTAAEVQVHPDGRFVYASNRGADSITVFALDASSGKLDRIQDQSTLGKTPRNFTIHPSGEFLLAANQNSDTITSFRLDPQSGKLTPTGKSLNIPKPVCLLFHTYDL
jgi:6-phosphogluconolactonase